MTNPADQKVQRRLAAILAADVVGFSAVMGQDEEGTLARIRSLRREIFEPKISDHRGRVVKTTGDGILVEFSSPVEAVRCAVEVQEILKAKVSQEPSQTLQLRIGINLGDIIIEDDGDIYGDGVNVAARLEQMAQPGSIWVSGKDYEEVRDKLLYSFEDHDEQQVKNIVRPLRVYSLLGGTVDPKATGDAGQDLSHRGKPSIGMLPFTNMSGDPEQDYFAEGVTEDIITELSRFRELAVAARSASFGCVANVLFQSFSYSLPGFWEEGGMFKGRHFDRSVILLCVRWYLAYNLSLRNLEEMMAERGVSVDHATVHRWVVRYSPELLERFNRRKRPVSRKWHIDETYIKVRGRWMYLYRAIDSHGDTVEFWFSERRNLAAAKRFLSKALKRHGRPERVVIDGSQTNREAILSCDATNRLQDRSGRTLKSIRIRQSAYLNNRIEQDHRAIKRRVRPIMGFKSLVSARTILGGIEMVHMMRKGQAKYACAQQLSLAEQFERLAA